nr:E3 ubiquitin-protein ligase SPL2 [Ipomoea batatas]
MSAPDQAAAAVLSQLMAADGIMIGLALAFIAVRSVIKFKATNSAQTVGLLHEEKILPLGKDITAVGICSSNRGIPEIKSCNSLPYFLSERTKDQMIAELAFKTKVLLWSWVVFGSLAIGILSYVAVRYWNRWKGRRPQRQTQRQNAVAQDATFEDTGDVVDRQLCVICLTRRRLAAFVPCGHVVCCQRCAFYVVRDLSPKCPCLKNGQYQWEERSICYYNS